MIATAVPNRPGQNRHSFSYMQLAPGISILRAGRLRVRPVTSVGAVVTVEVLPTAVEVGSHVPASPFLRDWKKFSLLRVEVVHRPATACVS